MYHIVSSSKYRRVVFDDKVEQELKKICEEVEDRYEIYFIEIGCDQGLVHFFVQSIPLLSPIQIVRIIKSITAREIFKRIPEVKKNYGVVSFGLKDILFLQCVFMEMKR